MADLDRSGWTAYATNDDGTHPAALALDGDVSTRWISLTTYPVDFWVDLGSPQELNYLKVLPYGGVPGDVEVYLSDDGVHWGDLVAWASWPDSNVERTIVFPVQTRRWVQLHIVSPAAAGSVSIAELNAGYDAAAVGTLSAHVDETLPRAIKDEPYAYPLHLTGGVTPYTITVLGGSMPDGITVDNTGLIAGTPTTAGTFTFSLRVVDTAGARLYLP